MRPEGGAKQESCHGYHPKPNTVREARADCEPYASSHAVGSKQRERTEGLIQDSLPPHDRAEVHDHGKLHQVCQRGTSPESLPHVHSLAFGLPVEYGPCASPVLRQIFTVRENPATTSAHLGSPYVSGLFGNDHSPPNTFRPPNAPVPIAVYFAAVFARVTFFA
jgi:hypothetical protein